MIHDIGHLYQQHLQDDLNFPRLISYPRCGSHWFRYIMEYTLEMPCIVSSYKFSNPNIDQCWGLHIHDRRLDNSDCPPTKNLKKVIYLWRNPVDVIYSQLRYDGNLPDVLTTSSAEALNFGVDYLIHEYGSHLQRYRFNNSDIGEILEITYEQMREDTKGIISKSMEFLNLKFDKQKLQKVISECTKLKISQGINDRSAIDMVAATQPEQHKNNKEVFKSIYENLIINKLKTVIGEMK
jgi:hypothetical protein